MGGGCWDLNKYILYHYGKKKNVLLLQYHPFFPNIPLVLIFEKKKILSKQDCAPSSQYRNMVGHLTSTVSWPEIWVFNHLFQQHLSYTMSVIFIDGGKIST